MKIRLILYLNVHFDYITSKKHIFQFTGHNDNHSNYKTMLYKNVVSLVAKTPHIPLYIHIKILQTLLSINFLRRNK